MDNNAARNETKHPSDLGAYLETRTRAVEKQFRYGLIGVVVVAIALMVYFQWAISTLGQVLTPRNVAEMAAGQVRGHLPELERSARKAIRQSVPEVVATVIDMVTDQALPSLRHAAEDLFADHAAAVAHTGAELAAQAFEEVVRHERELLLARADGGAGRYTSEPILRELEQAIDRTLAARLNDMPEETLGLKIKRSAQALRNLNARLRDLASKRRPSRKEALARRVIASWWTFIDQVAPEQTAAERHMGLRPIDYAPDEG